MTGRRLGTKFRAPTAVLSCLSYAVSSTCVTIMNKLVFSATGFHFPWFTLGFQNVVSVTLILLARTFGFIETAGTLRLSLSRSMAIPVISFVGFIFTNAQALRHLSLPVLTVWKSLAPLAVTIVEAIYFRQSFPPSVYAAMSLVAFSALVTAKFDLEYSLIGYTWAAANLLMNVAYLLTLRICLHNSNASSLDKTFHSNFLSLFLILPASFLANELPAVFEAFAPKNLTFKLCFVLSGALTTAVCASAFLTIQLTSGSTMSFVGGMNKIPIVLISIIVFDDNISVMGWVGVILGIFAGIVFLRAKARTSPYSTDSDSSPKIISSKSSSSESTLHSSSS